MTVQTAKQIYDGNGNLVKSQYYDPVTDKFLPGAATGAGTTQPTAPFLTGTMSGTSQTQSMAGAPLPCTITLNSTAGTRAIQLSTNGGTTYFTPTRLDGTLAYDAVTVGMINIVVTARITHVQFLGNASDTWSIL